MARPVILGLALAGAMVIAAGALSGGPAAADAPRMPFPDPPAETAKPSAREVAVLAGGCFWGMEGLFEHVRGVSHVTAGYTGGSAATANYPTVGTETTGHAESIRVEFDPRVVSYGKLLQVYFAVAHDPTEVNGQYPDQGPSYRSAVFPQSAAQRDLAARYIAELNRAHVFKAPIATKLETGTFYPAEDYHQEFMRRNPTHPYIRRWDVPRVAKFKAEFPQLYK